MCLHRIPKGDSWVHLLSQIRRQDLCFQEWILPREGVFSKEVSGRKVELDEVTVLAPLLESSSSQKSVPVTTTPISEEVNDDDHETSDQVVTEPRRSTRVRSTPEWYGNPVLEVMLLDHDEPTNYEEAMMSPDSAKWLEAMESEMDPCMRTKCGLWLTFPMIGKP